MFHIKGNMYNHYHTKRWLQHYLFNLLYNVNSLSRQSHVNIVLLSSYQISLRISYRYLIQPSSVGLSSSIITNNLVEVITLYLWLKVGQLYHNEPSSKFQPQNRKMCMGYTTLKHLIINQI